MIDLTPLRCAAIAVLILSLNALAAPSGEADYVGAEACSGCHAEQTQQWKISDHFAAMAEATEKTVLGDFNNVSVNFHDIKTRFYREKNQFKVETLGADGKTHQFTIDYTFGHFPLQQYLINTGDGHIQALNIAWDTRPKKAGGQRWYHLQPDEAIDSENPFFWTGHFQNWNSRCAECHSTNLEKNYNVEDHSYDTTWTDINVACEACHGPGSEHVALAKAGKLTKDKHGLAYGTLPALQWHFEEGQTIATPKGEANDDLIDMCGGCHSRRSPLSDLNAPGEYHDKYRLALLEENLYFADGQIQDEVFVLGSFLQSKMHGKGVTCNNCHNPHTGKVLIEGNGLCAQCHLPTEYDTPEHHHHPQGSAGAQCVDCHMPDRTYMGVDDRRDHQFVIPNPYLSKTTDAPNACTDCHDDKDNEWASKALKNWDMTVPKEHWSKTNARARARDNLGLDQLASTINQQTRSPIVRATLLQELAAFPSREAMQIAAQELADSNPMVRRAAVTSMAAAPGQIRWQILSNFINDPSRSVRFEIAANLSDVAAQLPAEQQAPLRDLLAEYRQSLALTADFPSTQVAIANLETRLGNYAAAEKAYQQALTIEPAFIPALLNLSDYYRNTGQAEKELPLLKKALKAVPESAAVHHSYGLYLIREKKYDAALPYLKAALNKTDGQPRYAYVYAVALDHLGKTDAAIDALKDANKQWPNQFDLLSTQILYLEKAGRTGEIYQPLQALHRIAPNSPQVQNWLQQYSNR